MSSSASSSTSSAAASSASLDGTADVLTVIRRACTKALTIEPGMDDDLHDLGLDSLSATAIVAYVQQDLGVRIPVRSLFEHPSVRSFTTVVDGHL